MDSTAQMERATGEKVPATKLELRTYVCSITEFQPCEPLIPVEIPCPQSLLCTGYVCVAIQQLLKTQN